MPIDTAGHRAGPGDFFLPRTERYEIRDRLGIGSLGAVFRALDRETGREVALKTLITRDPDDLYLLKREFRALADISHPNLVQLYDLEADGEQCFFTMQLVRGTDLLEHLCGSGPRPARDYERLRRCFEQLAAGLDALHGLGKLHRDVKPQNVLVDEDGQVILLDFGLVIGMDSALSIASQRDGFAGTLLYTSPEQAWGNPISPAADWYSAGVMLYECLTGQAPFDGPGLGALLDRQHRAPEPPRARVPSIPEDLDLLTLDLLRYEPDTRPGFDEIVKRLGGADLPPAPDAPRRLPDRGIVGREVELRKLREAMDAARTGSGACIRVEGPSGIGKSALVEHFLTALERDHDGVVLRARCHPNESVRFEAVDGLVDDLSRFLSRLPEEELEAVRPRGLRALLRMFPVLGRVPFADLEDAPDLADVDPGEIRRRGFGALRELLARIADRRPLALWSDDLHWGDLDSADFLRSLLRPPDPPPLLMILSYRSDDRRQSPLLRALDEEPEADRANLLEVGPLSPDEARELVGDLLPLAPPMAIDRIRALVQEAGGSPFFIGELARFANQPTATGDAPGDLGAVIRARLEALPSEALEILELVAVSGAPIDTQLVLELSGVAGRGRPRVYELCNGSLLRASSSGREVETYHGRIRDAILDGLDDPDRRRRHRQLADGLAERPETRAATLLEHTLGAGDEAGAVPIARAAAEEADRGLAFDRAAELYDLAWNLGGCRDDAWDLLSQRARVLAAAGRSAAAADSWETASAAAGRADAEGHVPATLRGRAAEQHFYAGELDEGMEALRAALRDHRIRLPRNPAAATRSALRSRLYFLMRGDGFTERPAADLPEATVARLDTLQGAARGTSMLDHTLSDALAVRHLLAVLDAGEPSRVVRALGLEAGIEANAGGAWLRRRSLRLLDRIDDLAKRTGDPFDRAWVELSRSVVGWYHGLWRECVERCDRAVSLMRAECIGISWDLAANRAFALSALVQLGRIRELAERLPALLDEARERGDHYALGIYLTGDSVFVPLAADDPDRARQDLEHIDHTWQNGLFTSQHFRGFYSAVHIALYEDEAETAWQRVEHDWRALRDAGFLRLDCVGNGLRHLRARAALAAAARGAGPTERLARVAEGERRHIARSSLPHASANAAAIAAGIASLRGDLAACKRELAAAADAYDAAEMGLCARSARWQLAVATGDSEDGRRAAEEMTGEGILDPARFARMALPLPATGSA